MHAPLDLLTAPDDAENAAELRAQLAADPRVILRVATAISHGAGQWPHEEITRACREEVPRLAGAEMTSVRDELEQTLMGRDVDEALQWLHEVGVMRLLLPEVEATVDLQQEAGRRHKDVWEHTKTVVKQAVRRPAVRWGALLHDIGKVPTRTFTSSGVHFHGHAEVGARMFDKICRRIPFERSMRQKIRFLIKHHLRSAQYGQEWTDSAVRRFHREMEPHLTDLLDLSRADITSKRPGKRRALLHQISNLARRMESLAEADAKVPPLPTGLGNAIMTELGIPPSRRIGELKQAMEAAIASGELEAHRDESYYLEWLRCAGLVP